ncbi:zinc metalloproteinase nas-13-like [Argiope bruennichi]|uniref:zinc metalloproteinase nas-13-like n=1 Tax=Argiope bruennichi TaxID=94029 RepID=UPI0024956D35|nr:zinc metalloproteinase nas-13-like [Argiope bruennichi]
MQHKDYYLDEDSHEEAALYANDINTEKDHLSIQVFTNAKGRNGLKNPESLWEDGKIPYQLSNKYDAEEKAIILEAMEEFKNKTCIHFEPVEKEDPPFIRIEPGSGPDIPHIAAFSVVIHMAITLM